MDGNNQNENFGATLDSSSDNDALENFEDEKRKKDLFETYRKEYRNAEQIINVCAAPDSQLYLPAVNELCVAGKCLGNYVCLRNEDELYKAIFHCICAQNSVYDCLINYCLNDIRAFMDDSGKKGIMLVKVVEKWSEYLEQILKVRENVRERKMQESNKDDMEFIRSHIDNKSAFESQSNDYRVLKKICDHFDLLRSELEAKFKARNEKDSMNLWRTIIIPVIKIIAPYIASLIAFTIGLCI